MNAYSVETRVAREWFSGKYSEYNVAYKCVQTEFFLYPAGDHCQSPADVFIFYCAGLASKS